MLNNVLQIYINTFLDTSKMISTGSVLLVSYDNQLFPFSSEALMNSPLKVFIRFAFDYALTSGVHIIKVTLYSVVIQKYIFDITGTYLSAIPHNQIPVISQGNENYDNNSDSAQSTTNNLDIATHSEVKNHQDEGTGENDVIFYDVELFDETGNFYDLEEFKQFDILTDELLVDQLIDNDIMFTP